MSEISRLRVSCGGTSSDAKLLFLVQGLPVLPCGTTLSIFDGKELLVEGLMIEIYYADNRVGIVAELSNPDAEFNWRELWLRAETTEKADEKMWPQVIMFPSTFT